MGDKHSYSNIGEEMKDALSDALQNGNFQTLNRLVSQTVTATLDEVGIHIPTDGSDVWSSRAQNADKAFGQTGADVPLWQQALGSDPGAGNTRRTADKGASQQRRYTGQASSQTFGSASRQQAGAFGQNASQAQSSASGGGQDVWQQRRQEQLKRQQAEQLRRQQLSEERVSHIVLMGSGEPLDNYENVLKFIDLITDEKGQNISSRNITLSTCGLVPEIYRLADEQRQITLALSLHAPDDETRKKLMPIANRYSINELLKACRYYFERTGRRISFEYSLVADINDNVSEAKKLSELLKGMNCHVNLIPVNPVEERSFQRSKQKAVQQFRDFLAGRGIQATIRREMGSDIHGACGQLRKSYQETANRNMMDTKEGEI